MQTQQVFCGRQLVQIFPEPLFDIALSTFFPVP
jgi:hypothetical protein